MRKLILGFLALLFSVSLAFAQVSGQQPGVQQSSQRADAATNVCAASYSSGTVPAVNVTMTSTCTPPAGQYVYITSIALDVCTNGTGSAVNQVTFTTTNITGAPVFPFSIAATASICQHWQYNFATPLKSTTAGTAVTVVSPTNVANNSYNSLVTGYFAP